jgi:hypothetical protein
MLLRSRRHLPGQVRAGTYSTLKVVVGGEVDAVPHRAAEAAAFYELGRRGFGRHRGPGSPISGPSLSYKSLSAICGHGLPRMAGGKTTAAVPRYFRLKLAKDAAKPFKA